MLKFYLQKNFKNFLIFYEKTYLKMQIFCKNILKRLYKALFKQENKTIFLKTKLKNVCFF